MLNLPLPKKYFVKKVLSCTLFLIFTGQGFSYGSSHKRGSDMPLNYTLIDRVSGLSVPLEDIQRHSFLIQDRIQSAKIMRKILANDDRYKHKDIKFILYFSLLGSYRNTQAYRPSWPEPLVGEIAPEGYPKIDKTKFEKNENAWLAFEEQENSLIVYIDATFYRVLSDISTYPSKSNKFLDEHYPTSDCLNKSAFFIGDFNRRIKKEIKTKIDQFPECISDKYAHAVIDLTFAGRGPRSEYYKIFLHRWVQCSQRTSMSYENLYIHLTKQFLLDNKSRLDESQTPKINCDFSNLM